MIQIESITGFWLKKLGKAKCKVELKKNGIKKP
jgi:hypothetical protein